LSLDQKIKHPFTISRLGSTRQSCNLGDKLTHINRDLVVAHSIPNMLKSSESSSLFESLPEYSCIGNDLEDLAPELLDLINAYSQEEDNSSGLELKGEPDVGGLGMLINFSPEYPGRFIDHKDRVVFRISTSGLTYSVEDLDHSISEPDVKLCAVSAEELTRFNESI